MNPGNFDDKCSIVQKSITGLGFIIQPWQETETAAVTQTKPTISEW